MKQKQYIIERRDESGNLVTSYEDLPEQIRGLARKIEISLDEIIRIANDFEGTWEMGEFGHEVGLIGPMEIGAWLAKWGLKRRLITWR